MKIHRTTHHTIVGMHPLVVQTHRGKRDSLSTLWAWPPSLRASQRRTVQGSDIGRIHTRLPTFPMAAVSSPTSLCTHAPPPVLAHLPLCLLTSPCARPPPPELTHLPRARPPPPCSPTSPLLCRLGGGGVWCDITLQGLAKCFTYRRHRRTTVTLNYLALSRLAMEIAQVSNILWVSIASWENLRWWSPPELVGSSEVSLLAWW